MHLDWSGLWTGLMFIGHSGNTASLWIGVLYQIKRVYNPLLMLDTYLTWILFKNLIQYVEHVKLQNGPDGASWGIQNYIRQLHKNTFNVNIV